jgi:cytoskeletal protein CcmA (bactofilin family)
MEFVSRARFRGQGGSIPTTMIVLSVIMVLAFSMAVLAFHHWGFGQHAHSRQAVRNLAEALAAKVVARLAAERDYGAKAEPKDSLQLSDPDHPGAQAFLTFSPARAAALKVPCSLNNQEDNSTVGPAGDRVPARASQVFIKAVAPDVSYLMEVMMHVPPYPYAVVASGPLTTSGPFEVSGVRGAEASLDSLPASKRGMATVASNNASASAVNFAQGAMINGDVQTVGRVTMAPGCVVRGAVKQNWEPAPLPKMNVQQYMDACSTQTQLRFTQQVPSSNVSDLNVEWVVRRSGDLVVQGDLTLQGGVLYVQGNLHVHGSVAGKGAIIVGGTTRIDRGASLTADNVVALMSKGDVNLSGDGRASSYLQGVVYSEGNLTARRLTMLGCLITNAPPGSGSIHLDDVRVIGAPISVGSRGGLVCDPRTDDDEVVFSAFAYPNPRNPRGNDMRYRITIKVYTDEGGAMLQDVAVADNLTRQQAEDLVLQCDAAQAPLKGSNGGTIVSREGKNGSLTRMRRYLDELEDPPPEGGEFLDFGINRLLQQAVQPRVLLWRSRPL